MQVLGLCSFALISIRNLASASYQVLYFLWKSSFPVDLDFRIVLALSWSTDAWKTTYRLSHLSLCIPIQLVKDEDVTVVRCFRAFHEVLDVPLYLFVVQVSTTDSEN